MWVQKRETRTKTNSNVSTPRTAAQYPASGTLDGITRDMKV